MNHNYKSNNKIQENNGVMRKFSFNHKSERFNVPDINSCASPLTGASDWGSVVEEDEIIEKYGRPLKLDQSLEKDINVLDRRMKQIEYGYLTPEYQAYIKKIPRNKRTAYSPRTPDKFVKYSRRSWDSMIRIWRKQLHLFDSEGERASFKMARNLAKDDSRAEPIKNDAKRFKHDSINASYSSSCSSDDIATQFNEKENFD